MKGVDAAEASGNYGPSLPDLQVPPIKEPAEEPISDKGADEPNRQDTLKDQLRHLQQLKEQWRSLTDEQRKKHLPKLEKYSQSSNPQVRVAASEILKLSQSSGT